MCVCVGFFCKDGVGDGMKMDCRWTADGLQRIVLATVKLELCFALPCRAVAVALLRFSRTGQVLVVASAVERRRVRGERERGRAGSV